jgi:branched-subunit amino acid aminotransferase/4-amino-4-deoxychorismate lyase
MPHFLFVFESLKSYRGVIFRLEEHLNRLFESAKTAGLKLPKSRKALSAELTHCLSQHRDKDAFLRLMVDQSNSYIFLLERKRPSAIYQEGVDLKTAVIRRHFAKAEFPEAKTNCF